MKNFFFVALTILAFLTGCTSKEAMKTAMFEVMEKNPEEFMEALQKANMRARQVAAENAEKNALAEAEKEFTSPKTPNTPADRAYLGPANAPILIVEYSDFQCPYCKRGYDTVNQVMKKYGDKVRLIYKHLPLDFHPQAKPAAKYFEAIAMQSSKKAYKFYDEVFENQEKLGPEGEKLLKRLAKKVGADMTKVERDIASDTVAKRIEADMKEAQSFNMTGTPGFLVNGVSLRGAYPLPEFEKIIDRHLKAVN